MALPRSKNIVVVGAGVIGLTIANELIERGYDVTVIAHWFPGDLSIEYTSPWAGAHWRSTAPNDNVTLQEYDAITYGKLLTLGRTKSEETGVVIAQSFDYYEALLPETQKPWFQNLVEDFEFIPLDQLPLKTNVGFRYTTALINSPHYLRWLLNTFTTAGGRIQKRNLTNLQEVFGPSVAGVFNCTGMGARTLGSVNDTNVFPTRGQTVVVHAPHVRSTYNYAGKNEFTYVIPRSDGSVVLGGTIQPNDFNPEAEMDVAHGILKRTMQLCPELMKDGKQPDIIRHAVGLRPTRVGGPRIEVEYTNGAQKTPVIHAYGHGGFGFQSSWGTAKRATDLLASALSSASTI